MDDTGEEWEFEEHSKDSLVVESRKSSLSWVWRKGLWLGKKLVVTGVVISSAPLLLPPLVVATFLGFAVSVPAGVVIVCYTCTQKLMNRLLPCPDPDTYTPASTLVEKEEGGVPSDVYFNGIKDIDELEQGEVAMAESDQKVVSSGIKSNVEKDDALAGKDQEVVSCGIEKQEQEDGSLENEEEVDTIKDIEEPPQEDRILEDVIVAEEEGLRIVDRESYVQGSNECDVVENTGSSHPGTEGLVGVDKKESSNEEATEVVALKEQEQEAVSADDVCIRRIKDGEEQEHDVILDRKSYGNESNVVEDTVSSDVKPRSEIDDFGGMGDKNKPSDKETVLLPEAIQVVTLVQEEAETIDAKKAAEIVMVASAAQDKEIVLLPEAIQVITQVQVEAENIDAEKAAEIVKVASATPHTSGNTAEEKILGTGAAAIEVVTVTQEGTDNTDAKKAAEIVMAASAAQDTSGNTAEVKKIHDDGGGVKHESSKKKNHKKKSKSREDYSKPTEHTKETGKVHMIEVKDHGKSKIGMKGDKMTTPQVVASSVPTVEMKSVILETIVEEGRSPTTTKRDEKPIRHRHVQPIVSNQAGENNQGTVGTKSKESLKEIMNEDKKAANDDLDKQRTIHPSTKPKGTTGGNIDKKRADQSGTGVQKDHLVGGGSHTSKQGSSTHTSVPANEKRIWDQIDALRLIVGYKMARKSSLNEEMKALYVFTGVKPPTPFKNSDDIHVTEEKLHFLMSVVGVK